MRKLRITPDAMYLARGFAVRHPGSAGERLVHSWMRGEVEFVLSGKLVDEMARTLSALGLPSETVERDVAAVCSNAETIVNIRHQRMGCDDPADDHLLETAIVGNARWIVSEDRAMLDLPRHIQTFLLTYGIEVITLPAFLDILDVVRDAPDDALFSFDIVDPGFSCLVCDHPDHADVACGSVAGSAPEPEGCICRGPGASLALAG